MRLPEKPQSPSVTRKFCRLDVALDIAPDVAAVSPSHAIGLGLPGPRQTSILFS